MIRDTLRRIDCQWLTIGLECGSLSTSIRCSDVLQGGLGAGGTLGDSLSNCISDTWRSHDDSDVSILRSDVSALASVLPDWDIEVAAAASLTSGQSAGLTEVKGVRCRSAGPHDFSFLATMLGEAAVWRPDKPTPTGDQVLADPRYALYLAGWQRPGDFGLIAERDAPVGAAWYRTYTKASHGYGFVAEEVPELSIAVVASSRHEGIGRRLLGDLINASVSQGYPALSLSVAETNPARRLYESVGFVPVENHGSSWTMVRHAVRSD